MNSKTSRKTNHNMLYVHFFFVCFFLFSNVTSDEY
jgi:hypothetical protein